MPDDDITYWTAERAKLQQQLNDELDTGVVGEEKRDYAALDPGALKTHFRIGQ